jgi:hypothetical protein
VRRDSNGRRRIAGVAVVQPNSSGLVHVVPAVGFGCDGVVDGPAAPQFYRRLGAA